MCSHSGPSAAAVVRRSPSGRVIGHSAPQPGPWRESRQPHRPENTIGARGLRVLGFRPGARPSLSERRIPARAGLAGYTRAGPSEPEAVTDNPLRAPTAQRPTRLSLKRSLLGMKRGGGVKLKGSRCLGAAQQSALWSLMCSSHPSGRALAGQSVVRSSGAQSSGRPSFSGEARQRNELARAFVRWVPSRGVIKCGGRPAHAVAETFMRLDGPPPVGAFCAVSTSAQRSR